MDAAGHGRILSQSSVFTSGDRPSRMTRARGIPQRIYSAGIRLCILALAIGLFSLGASDAALDQKAIERLADRVAKGDAAAAATLRKEAQSGNALAELSLGRILLLGRGLPVNQAEAFEWFERSAAQGNARAQLYLARLYKLGIGVARDELKACELVGLSAAQDEPAALMLRADCYYRGIGVRKDLVEMERLVRRSAKLGYQPAQKMVEAKILPSQVAATNAELRKQLLDVLLNSGQREPEPAERSTTEKQPR